MAHDPNIFPPSFTITFKDTPIRCHKQNTWLYTFTETVGYNHIFIDRSTREQAKGIYLWERQILREHDLDTWHNILMGLGRVGVETIEEATPSEVDKRIYNDMFGKIATRELVAPPELTPHQQNKVAWLEYMLDHDLLVPNSFQGSGPLEI